MLWGYGLIFGYCRSVIFYGITIDAISSLKTHLFLKFWCCMFCYISHGWIVFLVGMLWKSLPTWFSDKEKAKKYGWWIKGRDLYARYVKAQPYYNILVIIVFIFSFVIPFSYGCKINYDLYMESVARDIIS
jgi:hypothetical protein